MLAAARSLRLPGRSVVMTMLTHQAAAKVTSQNRPPAKTAKTKRPLGEVNSPSPFTSDTSSFNNSSCNTHMVTIRYDTRCYFNVRSKADISQLNLPHGTDN